MTGNVGAIDGFLRILFFLVTLCYAIIFGGTAAWVLVVPGAILFATTVAMWCPLYSMLGVNTSKVY
jgi:hypothetical protein